MTHRGVRSREGKGPRSHGKLLTETRLVSRFPHMLSFSVADLRP